MAVQTATNPDTGEQVVLVDGAWLPVSQTATNPDTGARAYLANDNWVVDDTAPAPTAEPEETSLLGYGLETGKALLGGAAGLLESAATGASFILPEEAEQAARARIAEIGGGVQEALAPEAAYEDNTYLDLVRGVGSTVPFLAAGALSAPALLGRGAYALGTGLGVGAGAGEAAQRAVAAGATEEEISKAAGLGIIPGAFEMFGPGRIAERFRKVLGTKADDVAEELSGSILRKISQAAERAPLGRVGKAAIDEGVQEALSEVGQNLIQRGVYDPERGVFTDTGESFGLGAGVGGLLQGLAEAIIPGRQRAAARKAEAEKAAEEEAMAATPEGETRDMFPEAPAREGPEPERLLDVEELAGVTEEDPIQVEAEAAVQARYSEAPLSPDAFAAAVANEVDIIRNRETPSEPTPETDLIERAEADELQELLDADEAAAETVSAEETRQIEAMVAADRNEAIADLEARRAEETQAKRAEILKEVLAQTNTASQVNTEKAFVAALTEAGIGDVTRIERDTTSPIDPEDARSAFPKIPVTEKTSITDAERQAITQKTYELAQQRPEPEVVADGRGVAELEALIPEKGAKPAQEAAPETPAPTTLVTPEFFDSLGIPKSAPIRRRKGLQGKEVSSPEVQEALQALIKNPKTSYRTRANLLNYRAFGKVVPPTAKLTTPVEEITASVAETTAPITFASVPQPIAATVAMPDTDKQKLDKRKNEPLPDRDIYKPKPAMSYYMQNATDSDQALRIIAFEGLVDPTLETTSPKDVSVREKKRADAAAQWVKSNLSPESKNKLKEYQEFYKRELAQLTAKGDVFLERMNAQQALAREEGKTSAEYTEAENERNQEILQKQTAEEFAAQNAEAYVLSVEGLPETELDGAVVELLRGTSSDSIADIDGLVDYLRSDAVAASMPLVSAETNNKLLDGDLKGALKQLATDSPNPMVRRTATVLSEAIKDTKIEFVETLETPRGDQFAGNYIPSQNLIQISLAEPLSTHTILHEAAHAVTSKVLDNKAHPVTIQLTKLFNDVKGEIPGTYGSESLKDFVAEVYTNPDFRATLAAHKPTGSKLTAWQRFTNAIKRLFGMPTTETENRSRRSVRLRELNRCRVHINP